jgi:hypothetical protein
MDYLGTVAIVSKMGISKPLQVPVFLRKRPIVEVFQEFNNKLTVFVTLLIHISPIFNPN